MRIVPTSICVNAWQELEIERIAQGSLRAKCSAQQERITALVRLVQDGFLMQFQPGRCRDVFTFLRTSSMKGRSITYHTCEKYSCLSYYMMQTVRASLGPLCPHKRVSCLGDAALPPQLHAAMLLDLIL